MQDRPLPGTMLVPANLMRRTGVPPRHASTVSVAGRRTVSPFQADGAESSRHAWSESPQHMASGIRLLRVNPGGAG